VTTKGFDELFLETLLKIAFLLPGETQFFRNLDLDVGHRRYLQVMGEAQANMVRVRLTSCFSSNVPPGANRSNMPVTA
jgi:hypothetical protein